MRTDQSLLPPESVAGGGSTGASGIAPVRLASRMGGMRSSAIRDLLAHAREPGMISFAGGLPSPDGFDVAALQQAMAATMVDARHALQYGVTEGEPALREALAAWMTRRGLRCAAADILVTTGSQQAIDLVARLLLDAGDVVALERPAYLAALGVFRLAQADVVGLPADDEGPAMAALQALVDEGRCPRLLYLVPDFANPTGATMSLARRRALLQFAVAHRVVILEDDPYGAMRFAGEALPSIASLAAADPRARGWVIHASTLSKIVAPALRIGWLVLPPELMPAAVIIKQCLDLHSPTVCQLAAAHYLGSGRLDDRLVMLRQLYRDRKEALRAALQEHFGDLLECNDPQGGMFLWARLTAPGALDATAWLRVALAHQVMFVPGEAFYDALPDPASLRLSFATTPPGLMAEGARRLRAALDVAMGG